MKLRTLWCVLLLLSGCSGDSTSMAEAWEVAELDLVQVQIQLPASIQSPVFLAPGEQIQLAMQGTNSTAQSVVLDINDRNWIISDTAVASINAQGLLTARAVGSAVVTVNLGGLMAVPLELSVSSAELTEITSIQAVNNSPVSSLAPCRAETFFTQGIFADGSERRLLDVSYQVIEGSAELTALGSGEVQVAARSPGLLTVQAEQNGVSGTREIPVDDSLAELFILPLNPALDIDGDVTLTAEGAWDRGTNTPLREAVNGGLEWKIVSGSDYLDINSDGTSATLQAVEAGTAVVGVECGAVSAESTVTVADLTTLSFDQSSPWVINLMDGPVQLSLSTGTSYSSANDVTEDATWRVVDGNGAVLTLSNVAGSKGEVTPLGIGTVTIQAEYQGETHALAITVQ